MLSKVQRFFSLIPKTPLPFNDGKLLIVDGPSNRFTILKKISLLIGVNIAYFFMWKHGAYELTKTGMPVYIYLHFKFLTEIKDQKNLTTQIYLLNDGKTILAQKANGSIKTISIDSLESFIRADFKQRKINFFIVNSEKFLLPDEKYFIYPEVMQSIIKGENIKTENDLIREELKEFSKFFGN